MATVQSLIRAYVRTAVKTATGLDDKHVFSFPNSNVPVELMPCISIFSLSDKPLNAEDDHQKPHERLYSFVVDIQVAKSQAEDSTDAMAVQCRQAILVDDSLDRNVFSTRWNDQSWGTLTGSPSISGTALTFECHYMWYPDNE